MRDDDEHATTEPADLTPATLAERKPLHARASERIAGERYRIVDKLGHGGMGEVHDARDLQIGRDVAIKRLRADAPSDRAIQRFLREAKIQGRLEHPAIVPVHELGRGADGRPYFAMKKLAGTTLAKHIQAGTPRQRLLRAFTDVCLAVELAHTRGFVHRDLKPDNIMLGDFGETYVLDWGVAKVLGGDDDDLDPVETDELVTIAGSVIGTPGYMAPEQARGLPDVDARADVYSLGCVLFEILAGEPLHPRGKDGIASALANIDTRPSRRTAREIPPELDDLVVRATAFERGDRVPTARALADEVQRYLDGDRDLLHRKQLAREQLAAAERAFAAGDRRAAMRDAGRALALDPMDHRAAGLISRLLLEPAREVPPEVERTVDAESRDVVRRTARAGTIASLGYVLLVPMLAVASRVDVATLAALFVLASANAGMLYAWARSTTFVPKYAVLVTSTLLIAVCCRIASPFLVGPGVAALTALGIMAGQFITRRAAVLVGVAALVAVLVPWLGELAGLWTPTMHLAGSVLVIDAPMFTGGTSTYAWLVAITSLMIGAAIVFTLGIRLSEQAARRQLHLIAWQLRQLLPA